MAGEVRELTGGSGWQRPWNQFSQFWLAAGRTLGHGSHVEVIRKILSA